jgi:actin-related protein
MMNLQSMSVSVLSISLFACVALPTKMDTKVDRLTDDVNFLLEEKLLDGEIASWQDKDAPQLKRHFAVFLTFSDKGKLCRDYYTVIVENGTEKKPVFGTSCRLSQRRWERVNWSFRDANQIPARKRFEFFQEVNRDAPEPEYLPDYRLPAILLKSVQKAETQHDLPLREMIDKASEKQTLNPVLIHSVIKQESNYNPKVCSHVGACGLMQLMPLTAKEVGVNDRFNPSQNLKGGTRYLRKMLNRRGINGNIPLALAAYNAGYGNVKKYGYKVPPFKETQNYVKKIMGYFKSQ